MEVVKASDYDATIAELDAALAHIDLLERRFVSRGFCRGKHGPKPEERRVEIKTRLQPLDVAQEQHPL
jgi:hypothetical protein